MRKKRPPVNYVTRLEHQLAAMANYVNGLHSISDEKEREKYLREVQVPSAEVKDTDGDNPEGAYPDRKQISVKQEVLPSGISHDLQGTMTSEQSILPQLHNLGSSEMKGSFSMPPTHSSNSVFTAPSTYQRKVLDSYVTNTYPKSSEPNRNDGMYSTLTKVPSNESSSRSRASVVYGPTSVYRDSLIIHPVNPPLSSDLAIRALNTDPDILECLKLFFKWQYPDHNMFIFREAFLIDFFLPKPDSLYCSPVLVWSICALGLRMSEDDRIYSRLLQFYTDAKNHLLQQLANPSITSLQSFLLLAFYDICSGHNSSGWMLLGNAMRMGFDLGFQLNPEVWFVKPKEDLSPLDVDIRSRIYWGTYVADHFISLLLGRPSLLKALDALISETTDLPDLEWIDDFMYSSLKDLLISVPIRKIVHLISILDNMLHDIFTKLPENDDEDLDLRGKLEKLAEYNTQIRKWKQLLPAGLQWDREHLKKNAENPTLTAIRYYYYILVLCLNRPFVGIEGGSMSPLSVCREAMDDLYEAVSRFRNVHGCRRISIFIVYCIILLISVLLLTNTELVDEKRERLTFFMQVLKELSKTWKLAEKSYNLISVRIEEMDRLESEQKQATNENENREDEPRVYNSWKRSNSLFDHDLSLVNANQLIAAQNTDLLFEKDLDFLGGPPVLMTLDLFNEDWEALFPDYMFKK